MTATREVEHEITVAAPAASVYALVADAGNWPQVFGPTVHVEHVAHAPGGRGAERLRIWATANGTAKGWTSRRELDPDGLRIDFRQEVSQPPVGAMSGAWVIEPGGERECRVRLLHTYRAATGDPADLAWIDRAVDRNSDAELAALKRHAEHGDPVISFADTVSVAGRAEDVFDFLDQAQHWPDRLPHVAGVSLEEPVPGLQTLAMDTEAGDGSRHATKSIRVCLPHRLIAYKQIGLPALLSLHTGQWVIEPDGGGVRVTSRHSVRIEQSRIESVLGTGAGPAQAEEFVRTALSTNSLATLGHAKSFAEGR
ncbi:aromatase/cyclase [Amycolatopsis sp. 195334CR]|uniref:aromatase/cyclase n=1 Tax=Amycolatopsis sp. 195334CR TaxID=2814588 RepID=UPI001A8D8CE5|nr:aromatase/cyclase [Amycolatopsis sp. 195334CR]MBN6040601.1 aromatase/cyclase [Amycolatopsis sp. 195334CR]